MGIFFLGVGYGIARTKDEDQFNENTEKGSLLSFEAGAPFWLGDIVAIEPSLNYSIGSAKP